MKTENPFEKKQERPKVSKCLGVFGLSLYTQEQDLRQAFEKYGPVDDLQIVYDHQTGKSRGFAFIYMHSLQDAKEVSSCSHNLPGIALARKLSCITLDF